MLALVISRTYFVITRKITLFRHYLNMAFRSKYEKIENISKDLIFDGGIQSNTRSILVKELLKYLLYERQQIPIPYEHVKQSYKNIEQLETQISQAKRKTSGISKLERKRISHLITGLEELFGKLVETFELCPEIREVLILLGGTIVSPKESYLIIFPPYHPESTNLSSKFCVRYLLKELIGQDFVGKMKDLPTTNAVFLVKAPVESGISWFLPKPNFTPSRRGRHVSFKLISNTCSDVFIHDLTHEENEIEISGIEPFDISGLDCIEQEVLNMFISGENGDSITENGRDSVKATVERAKRLSSVNSKFISFLNDDSESTKKIDVCDQIIFFKSEEKCENVSCDKTLSSNSGDDTLLHKTLDDVCSNDKKSVDEIECIWFQAPCVIKGYKDKSTSKSSDLIWKNS